MEVWVNGVVVETAVSIHYLKPCVSNKIDNKKYKCTEGIAKSNCIWVQPRLTKIFPSLEHLLTNLDLYYNKWIICSLFLMCDS